MKAVKLSTGEIIGTEDVNSITGTIESVLSQVIINKEGSTSKGAIGEVVAVKNNKVVVKLADGKHGTYSYDVLLPKE